MMFMLYQIKVGLCLIAFYLMWKWLLSRETFHRFNRIALLTVMVLALVLPWIKISMDAPQALSRGMVVLEDMIVVTPGGTNAQQASWQWTPLAIITAFYALGALAVLSWLLYGYWRLHRLMGQDRTESLPGGITVHVLPGEVSPFSYFSHIVISEQDYRDNPREILVHEQAHIRLRHSLDVMFIGLVTVFQWWNPAVWLLGREMRQVHEYEADEAVLQQGIDARQYQLLLIKKSVGNQLFSMANNFNYQSLKKRIRMMTINKSNRWNRLRALALLPIMALALVAFANHSAESAQAVMGGSVSGDIKVYDTVDQLPEFPGGEAAMMKFLYERIVYPAEAIKNNVQGRVLVQLVIDATGQVTDVEIVRSVDEQLDAEVVRVCKLLPKFNPGLKDGKAVAVKYTLPVAFTLTGEK